MATQTEGQYVGDWLKYEQDSRYAREAVTILAGSGSSRVLTSGMVLGRKTTDTTGAATAGTNTGNGAMGTITVSGSAIPGTYKLVFIEPATDLGRFVVYYPDGSVVGPGTVGTAFSGGGLAFTLADGATDFIAGDSFSIVVEQGVKYLQFDEDGTTGAQIAAGILLNNVTALDAVDAVGVAIVRGPAIVSANGITWPSSTNAAEKAAAILQLNALGIQVREGA
jgi:hypothetical protein